MKIRHSDNNQVAWKQNDQQYPGVFCLCCGSVLILNRLKPKDSSVGESVQVPSLMPRLATHVHPSSTTIVVSQGAESPIDPSVAWGYPCLVGGWFPAMRCHDDPIINQAWSEATHRACGPPCKGAQGSMDHIASTFGHNKPRHNYRYVCAEFIRLCYRG